MSLVLENRFDLLVVMPIGHGKSAVFMILPMVTACTIIVVVPLTILVVDTKRTRPEPGYDT